MREILYKAKRLDNGEWYEGASLVLFYGTPENKEKGIYGTAYFVRRGSSAYSGLADENGTKYHAVELVPIDPLTIGQFTGLCDKNEKKIFEGDICSYTFDNPDSAFASANGLKVRTDEIFYSDWRASFAIGTELCNNDLFKYVRNGNRIEIIGNIHDKTE